MHFINISPYSSSSDSDHEEDSYYSGGDSDSSNEDKEKKEFKKMIKEESKMRKTHKPTPIKQSKQDTWNFTDKTRTFCWINIGLLVKIVRQIVEEATESDETETFVTKSIKEKFYFLHKQLFNIVEGERFSKQIKKYLK